MMMIFLGYFAAVFMGVVLGLIGGGGSILTVPVLVYFFGLSPSLATRYSLLVVGVCSLIGSWAYLRRKLVDLRIALIFALPALVGVSFSRRWVLPSIPQHLTLASWVISKDLLILMSFAGVMFFAACSMIRGRAPALDDEKEKVSFSRIVFQSLGVGAVTGFVGAGGGFLIVPALVQLLRLPMNRAIGTSLVIIAVNAGFGFLSDHLQGAPTEWSFVLPILGTALLGILIGTYLNRFIPNQKLKPAFGWFVLTMGGVIFLKELGVFFAWTAQK